MEEDRRETGLLRKLPIAEEVVKLLRERSLHISTAESLTGGLIAASLTNVSGASNCFGMGFVTYANEAKQKMLSVKAKVLGRDGAVSEECAREMAMGAKRESGADIAVSVTGNAGPDAMEGKPVGLVYIGVAAKDRTEAFECHFHGDRSEIRQQTVEEALRLVRDLLLTEMN